MINITYIYLVENIEPGINKVYIGKTKEPGRRLYEHKIKFGKKINYTIIDQVNSLNKKDWKPLESYWIEQFKQWGFNVLNKNVGGGGMSYATDCFKEKISKILKGIKRSEETKQKMRGKRYSYGPMSDIVKQKISMSKKGIKKGPMSPEHKANWEKVEKKKRKPVEQYTKEGVLIAKYNGLVEAHQVTNINNISEACLGKIKTAGGYVWKYV